MELRECIEELQKIEQLVGSSAQVFVHMSDDEVELFGIELRQVDERTYEVIFTGWL